MPDPILCAGPTLTRALRIRPDAPLAGIEVVPPVRRGDVLRLVSARPPGPLVIVDGLFHAALAVGHAEIRAALAAGWSVWGLSSMGAIRAREMRHLGMRGFGRVYELYCQEGMDFRDDEVALLHEPDPPYQELSEPLVHLRGAIHDMVAMQLIADDDARTVLAELEAMWFGDRTVAWTARRLQALRPDAGAAIDAAFEDFDRHRLKSHDLLAYLEARPFAG